MSTKRKVVVALPVSIYSVRGAEEPGWIITRTASEYDAMVNQIAKAMFEWRYSLRNPLWKWENHSELFHKAWRNQARVALRAIGIERRTKK